MATIKSETFVSATLTEIASAFAAWQEERQKNPREFMSLLEGASTPAALFGAQCGDYFVELLGRKPAGEQGLDYEDVLAKRAAELASFKALGIPAPSWATTLQATAKPIPAIGEYWPEQGGINAGLFRGDGTSAPYFLIFAENDSGNAAWGAYGTDECGAKNAHDGQTNTRALLASGNKHPAAELASAHEVEGLRDFYLPSRRELALCSANIPEAFEKSGWYWSSTQGSPSYAFVQDFEGGCQDIIFKDGEHRVRAVRRVLVI